MSPATLAAIYRRTHIPSEPVSTHSLTSVLLMTLADVLSSRQATAWGAPEEVYVPRFYCLEGAAVDLSNLPLLGIARAKHRGVFLEAANDSGGGRP